MAAWHPSMQAEYSALAIGLAYLIGSVSFAVLTSRLFGLPDPRSFGSKNPGATNVLRTGNKAAALLTLFGDGAKGWIAVYVAKALATHYGLGDATIALAALAVVLGHIYPLFSHFAGGKGVATIFGVLLALSVWLGLAVIATWLLAAWMWRTSSLSALIAAGFAPIYAFAVFGVGRYTLLTIVLIAILVWRHKENIRNLIERREGAIGKPPKPGDMPSE